MVDLSQVKMPVVEYEDGVREPLYSLCKMQVDYFVNEERYSRHGQPLDPKRPRITAIHPAEPVTQPDGWVDFGLVKVKRFGGSVIAWSPGGCGFVWLGDEPTWARHDVRCDTDELDAAYAAHTAANPVLVWDDSLAFLKRATSGGILYEVSGSKCDTWMAQWFTSDDCGNIGRSHWDSAADAKAACERHAKGE